jgi:predicted metal-dependent RNase
MTDTDISIDMERIEELIEEYANAKRRQKKREIENEVLAETVWKALPENHPGQLVLTEDQVERIRRSLPDDEEEADSILRRLYVKRL